MSLANDANMIEIARAPNATEIAKFLSTRNGAEMARLVQSFREPAAIATFTSSLLLVPPRPKVAAQIAQSEKPKKALNAFVGFRSYYMNISEFKSWPMKKLSRPLGMMWEADPDKSLWSLMAKAWSTIRDQIGKDNAPLNEFFRVICPALNITAPDSYLYEHGWQMTIDMQGNPTLVRHQNFSPRTMSAATLTKKALSVEDIISMCQTMGYAQGFLPDENASSGTFLAAPLDQISLPTDTLPPVLHTQALAPAQTPAPMPLMTAATTHAARVARRRERRARREAARNSRLTSGIQEQINSIHNIGNTEARLAFERILFENHLKAYGLEEIPDFSYAVRNAVTFEQAEDMESLIGEDLESDDEPDDPFYETLLDLLTGDLPSVEDDASEALEDSLSVEHIRPLGSAAPVSSAFRDGADENATLPSYNFSQL